MRTAPPPGRREPASGKQATTREVSATPAPESAGGQRSAKRLTTARDKTWPLLTKKRAPWSGVNVSQVIGCKYVMARMLPQGRERGGHAKAGGGGRGRGALVGSAPAQRMPFNKPRPPTISVLPRTN